MASNLNCQYRESREEIDVHEANDGGDLNKRKDKLSLAICLDAKKVDNDNSEEKNSDEYGLCQIWIPVPYRERPSDYLQR